MALVDRRAAPWAARPKSCAFTVVELLVVLGVAGVLLGVVLPAIQHAREAARRVQCQNNLRQIGLALHTYESNARCLPSGWVQDDQDQNGWGWLAMLLPVVDESTLFNSINFDQSLGEESNRTARLVSVSSFLCPSDHTPLHVPFLGTSPGGPATAAPPMSPSEANLSGVLFEVSGANYAGVFGPDDPSQAMRTPGPGAFCVNSRTRFVDMTNGASQTLVVGERSASHLATTWTGMNPRDEEGAERVVGFAGHAPNEPEADEAEFSSRHPGGVYFLLGDGAVRFLGNNIDQSAYRALARCAGTPSGSDGF